MQNVTADADPQVDIWAYVDALNLDALGVPSLHDVHYVYRDGKNRFDQVLIGTGRFNALLAVIVDRRLKAVVGHHLLDLNGQYDLQDGHQREVR